MPATIPIQGLASSDPTPGTYVEIDFATGPVSSGTAVYGILLLGNKLAAGTATADTTIYGPTTAVQLAGLSDAQTLFGLGSELYRMYKRVLSVNSITPIYAVAVGESTGAKASKAITIATTATANGALRVLVEDDFVDVPITSGDTPAVIAANAVTYIGTKVDWPVTAAAAIVGAGPTWTVTLTAVQKGLRGNWLRVGSQIIGTTVGTTTDTAPMVFLAGGTVADSYTTALSTIISQRFYYIVSADDGGQSSTNLSSLVTQVGNQAAPTTGIRQTVVAASNDGTAANVTTQATGINNARLAPYVFLPFSDIAPSELAAIAAGARSFNEAAFSVLSLNFDFWGQLTQSQGHWPVPAPRSGAPLTRAQIVTALNNGISPVGVTSSGQTYLVSLITSKSQTGGVGDYRIRDAHKVSIADRFGDDLGTSASLQLTGQAIGDDPVAGQRPIPGVATPRNLKAIASDQIKSYGVVGLLQNYQAIIAGLTVLREKSPSTRLSVAIPLQTADVLHQIGILISQTA